MEYTPYGETWVEENSDSNKFITYKFTSKELDEETGLYYFGARYYDPKTSTWASCDPALEEYLPNENKDNERLPGQGGVFNPINLNLYCYAGNNPLKFVDPTGNNTLVATVEYGVQVGLQESSDAKGAGAAGVAIIAGIVIYCVADELSGNQISGKVDEITSDIDMAVEGMQDKAVEVAKKVGEKAIEAKNKLKSELSKIKDKIGKLFQSEETEGAGEDSAELPEYPGNDPEKAPEGYKWKGKPNTKPGDKEGSYHNPETGEVLKPDLDHPDPIGPHWDYKDPNGNWSRLYPDGSSGSK